MNQDKKNNLLTWLVVILIIANIAVITMFWLSHNQKPPRPAGTPAEFLTKELGLNEQQQQQLHQLANKHHMESEKIRGKIKDARDHLFDLLKQTNVTDSSKQQAAASVADNLKQLELLTFEHFQQVRALCNPEQQKKFDQVINQVLQMIGGRPAGPPNGPPPGEHPGGPQDGPPPPDSRDHP